MNKTINFEDIYNDFFGKKSIQEEPKIIPNDKINYNEEIDKLYITKDSKELLKKIINYILNYKTNIYVNFNIKLIMTNKETVNTILKLIESANKSNNYTDHSLVKQISFYKLDNISSLEEIYNNYGIYVYKDLEGLTVHDSSYIKKFIHFLNNHKGDRKINILVSSSNDLTYLFQDDKELEDNLFNFTIKEVLPTTNEILNDILSIVKDFDKDKLLNYIENTFTNNNLDYPTYRDNLCKYISFNNELPPLETSKTTKEIFEELNNLVGLEKVKKSLYDLVDLISLKKKTKDNLTIKNINLHMLFLGNPGTGKTTVARLLAGILYNLKYIRQNKLIEVSSKDLVAEYVGQTAPKTMEVINRAKGGILFIDEAYSLAVTNNNSYNAEAIATLIKAMEDYRDDLVVIFAGYTKEMNDFINSNSGISSRIGYTFIFEDYTTEELKQIFIGMIKSSGFTINDSALEKLEKIIEENKNEKNFGNARFVRNVYEKTIILHASNTKNIKDIDKLKLITEKDITY